MNVDPDISAAFAGDDATIADDAVLLSITQLVKVAPPDVICAVRLKVLAFTVAELWKIKVFISVNVHDSKLTSAA